MTRPFRILACAVALAGSLIAQASGSGPLPRDQVPDPLKPWIDWTLRGHEEELCPSFLGDSEGGTQCSWPSALTLSLDERGGHFSERWHLDHEGWVGLPGDAQRWPLDLKVDRVATPVVSKDDHPAVFLRKGDHLVEGSFLWESLPESIPVPTETGLLNLTVGNKAIAFPNRGEDGQLWLHQAEAAGHAEDNLEVVVHRRLEDEIPFQLVTHLQLEVSGKNREIVLGPVLLDGFTALSLESPLPARLEPDGRLRLQVRPGRFSVTFVARHAGPVQALALPAIGGSWPPEEVWVFDARADLRLVMVQGVAAIDPQQTTLPEDWKSLPAYRVRPGEKVVLDERRRGDSEPAPDQLNLQRNLWLDFSGNGFSVSDVLNGEVNRSSRLEMRPELQLGRVAVNGKDQPLTHLAGSNHPGVELRQGKVAASADSRLEGTHDVALGWDEDFHSMRASLHIPPGWRLFALSGADDASGTWVKGWSLLDLFLALMIAVSVGRLFGKRWGAAAVLTMALTYTETGAPRYIWLAVLVLEALTRVLPLGRLRSVVRAARVLAWTGLALIAVPFLIQQVRVGVYPAQAQTEEGPSEAYFTGSAADGLAGGSAMDKSEPAPKGAPSPALVSPPAPPEVLEERSVDRDEAEAAQKTPGGERKMAKLKAGKAQSMAIIRGSSVATFGKAAPGYLQEIDSHAMVQTGPGVPQWSWVEVPLRWNGPVDRSQVLKLWLLPPWLNLLLALLRVVAISMLGFCLVGLGDLGRKFRRMPPGSAMAGTALLALALLVPQAARAAENPTDALLNELRERLVEKPACFPDCATAGRMMIDVSASELHLRIEVNAAVPTAVPLPSGGQAWSAKEVLLDGKPAQGLWRSDEGVLWLDLPSGQHQVAIQAALPDRATLPLSLTMKPHHVTAHVTGWTLEGLHEDGEAEGDLQLTRSQPETPGNSSLQPGALPAFVRVERLISLGLTWEVETRVVRASPSGAAVVVAVPLLPGESVTTANVRVSAGKVLVSLSPQAGDFSWHSTLRATPQLQLVAQPSASWTEVWKVVANPMLHVNITGIPRIHTSSQEPGSPQEWRPWPGESLRLDVQRPEGAPGQTLTIDSSKLELTPGSRSTEATLTLHLRSSRGAQHVLQLPPGAVLQSVALNGTEQPIRQEGLKVTLPLSPGAQSAVLKWREAREMGWDFQTSPVNLGTPSVNHTLHVDAPEDRWILFLRGPRLGPAVLFWSLLIVLLLIAGALGRTHLAPLRTHQWLLLALGLSQVPPLAAAVVVGWFLIFGWRAREPSPLRHRLLFNLQQVLLVLWTLGAAGILIVAIQQGLLGHPDMNIAGNGSFGHALHWFADRAPDAPPQATVLSVPMVVYRLAMLSWALWLAFAVLKWIRWGFSSFIAGGAWRRRVKVEAPGASRT